ncbi:DUF4192 domain-containing protein [Isoptericola sp. NPDC057391]|uniref:DUF4192 domain-containing protein n=1 Tax=Isoptericola sp. NPDC057391 TaxID=3346117 RepID=UPI0036394799
MDAAYATDRAGEPGLAFDTPLVLRSSCDLLAAVPYLLGFRPRECLVVVAVTEDGRVGLVARTGLADPDEPSGGPGDEADGGTSGSAGVVARAVARVGARLALVVLYTASPPDEVRAREAAVVGALEESLGPTVDVEAWLVGPDGYRGLDCVDPACCPARGRPVSELEHGEVGAAFVVAGRVIAASEQEAHRVRALPAGVRGRVAKAAVRAERTRAAAADAARDALGRWRAEAYGVWCDLMRHAAAELRTCPAGDVELPPARLGRLAVALADVRVRDAVLLSLVPGGREAADRTARAGGDGDVAPDVEAATARAIARVVDPRVGVPPDGATADAARLVLEQLVGGAPRRWHAPPLALLGFLAWWRGDGWLAARRVRESARQDPTYRLAALVAGVLEAAVPPGWVSAAGGPASEAADGRAGAGEGALAADADGVAGVAGVARPTVG